jgi:integrase
MIIKRTCLFVPDKQKGYSDARLRYRVTCNGWIAAFSVGYRVDTSKWNTETQRCVNNSTHGKKRVMARIINKRIEDYTNACEAVFNKFEADNITPGVDAFRNAFRISIGKERTGMSKSLSEYFDEFINEQSNVNNWAYNTILKLITVRNHLSDFDSRLTFSSLDERKLNMYVVYLRDTVGLRNSSMSKQISSLKWFLRWATRKGYNNNMAFQVFAPRLKMEQKRVIFLEWTELMRLYEYNTLSDHLDLIRDIFCFCCFTSLRYSDVVTLKRTSVHDSYILVTTIKTNDTLQIELNKYSAAILKKYKGVEYPSGLVFPVVSNQKMNEALKELCKECKLDTPISITYYKGSERIDVILPKYELITTHTGRRTFICNAIMLGIAPQIVMKWTGHSNYEAMKPYIDVADSAKREAMSLFNR